MSKDTGRLTYDFQAIIILDSFAEEVGVVNFCTSSLVEFLRGFAAVAAGEAKIMAPFFGGPF